MDVVRTRIKICGITRVSDAVRAAELGADAIGLVFHAASPRNVDVAQARAILSALPPFVSSVGLFVDADADTVRRVLDSVPLDLLQFHGEEPEAYCAAFPRPYIKALKVRDGTQLAAALQGHPAAAALLLDKWDPARAGGTGERFDWDLVPADAQRRLVLAGGLDADNAAEAVRRLHPWAVDVSSGVEEAPGLKSPARMRAFIEAVNRAVLEQYSQS